MGSARVVLATAVLAAEWLMRHWPILRTCICTHRNCDEKEELPAIVVRQTAAQSLYAT